MYCTKDLDGKELHYLIDRRNDFWYVPGLHFPVPGDDTHAQFHTDTLIDGELVIDTTTNHQIQAKYLVFDCLMLDGNSLMNRTLDKRIAYFGEKIFKPYQNLYKIYPEELQYVPFVVELKQMQFAYGIEMMFRQILPSLPHGNDGLIFTCRSTDYKPGTDPHILKWKPELENSVDFRLSLDFPLVQPDAQDIAEGITQPYIDYDAIPTANLLVGLDSDRDDYYSTLYLTPSEWADMKNLNEPLDNRIAECYMDEQHRWRWMRWRDDKDTPNHISTVESVIESIRDRVTEKELIMAAKRIRDEWKLRNAAPGTGTAAGANGSAGGGGSAGATNGAAGVKRKASDQGVGRPSPGPPGGSG
jgi:mRNA guanylyltransferase